jgi:hypothetical protein
MAIQSSVGLYAPVAVPGQAATPQSVYTPQTFLADDTNGVHVGRFVWIDSDGNASNTQVASTLPLGFAERVVDAPNYAVTSDGSDVVPPTHPATVAVKGDYYVVTATAATVGQAGFAMTDGTVKTDASGATVSGGIETAWRVKTAGSANDVIIISNWS